MRSKATDRVGKFYLKPRNGIQYICWYDSVTGQTDGVTTGTADIEAAREKLHGHALKQRGGDPKITDAQLAAVMQTYYVNYAQDLPSAHVQRSAQGYALDIWNDDPNCSALDRTKQMKLVDGLRELNLSDWTINGVLDRIWAAMNWYKRDNVNFVVPAQITAEDWKPLLEDNDQVYSVEELASLFNAACREVERPPVELPGPDQIAIGWGSISRNLVSILLEMPDEFTREMLEAKIQDRGLQFTGRELGNAITHQVTKGNIIRGEKRGDRYRLTDRARSGISLPHGRQVYSREHWWRWLVLAIGTAGRVTAVLELTWPQIKLDRGRIHLNPEGRRQTKKRRATTPICPTLSAEIATWKRDSNCDHVITYYGNPLATYEFFDLLAETAGVGGSPNVVRHTVRTWLAERGVPDADADMFMAHKGQGSATGARYTHRKPEYLKTVSHALEELFEALSDLVDRPFAGRRRVDQPLPDDPTCDVAINLRGSNVAVGSTMLANFLIMERETRLELATPTLARKRYPYENNDLEVQSGTEGATQNKDLPR